MVTSFPTQAKTGAATAEMIAYYHDEHSIAECAAKFGLSYRVMQRKLHRAGVRVRPQCRPTPAPCRPLPRLAPQVFLRLYNGGWTIERLAATYSVSYWRARNWVLGANGVLRPQQILVPPATPEMCEAYQDGLTIRQVAVLWNRAYSQTRRMLDGAGVEFRPRGGAAMATPSAEVTAKYRAIAEKQLSEGY